MTSPEPTPVEIHWSDSDQWPDQPDDGVSRDLTYAVAEASATHPAGTPLDDNGDPIPPDQQ